MTEIYLIRHAEAEGNIFRRLHGQYDSMLTPRGHRQVKLLEKRFENIHIDACYASDLTRTSLTSRGIYLPKGLRVHRDRRFREVHVGRWEDMPYGHLFYYEHADMLRFHNDPPAWHVDGAEYFDEYTQRCMEGIIEAAEAHDGGAVAVFSHGAAIRGVLMRLFYPDDITKVPYSDNTGVSKLYYHKGQFTYEYLNDSSQLTEDMTTAYVRRWWKAAGKRDEADLYHLPLEEVQLPKDLTLPEMDRQGMAVAAMMNGEPVGVISMGKPSGETGTILGISLLPEYEGRYYGDQILGCAFSYFRRSGCKTLCAAEGVYPDGILERYAFDPVTRSRNIDPTVFDWRPAWEKTGP